LKKFIKLFLLPSTLVISSQSFANERFIFGLGAGWITTDLFDFQNSKHGASSYAGIVGRKYDNFDDKAIYGAGLGYHYFSRFR